jgi:hypothetical protein
VPRSGCHARERESREGLSPDALGDALDELELAPSVVGADLVALRRRREAALGDTASCSIGTYRAADSIRRTMSSSSSSPARLELMIPRVTIGPPRGT